MTTLLDRLGGKAALKAAVDEFYARLVRDHGLLPFFVGVNVEQLKKHQYNFMSTAFTKIPEGMNIAGIIKEKHARLFEMGLSEYHFDLVASHFVATLQYLKVEPSVIDEAAGVILPLRPTFVECAAEVRTRKIKKISAVAVVAVGAGIAVLAAMAFK